MDKFKDEELEFLAKEDKATEEDSDLDLKSIKNTLNEKGNVFVDSKPIKTTQTKADKSADDFNPDDYLDEQEFKRMGIGLWLSENRRNITKTIVVLLIFISAAFFVYSLYNLVVYFKAGNPAEGLTDNNLAQNTTKIEPLVFSEISVFANNTKNDLAISLTNNNPRFYANFDYCFKQGNIDLSCGNSFILPSSEKYILAFAVETENSNEDISFFVSKISWKRISREISDYQSFQDERLNFSIYDIDFKPAASKVSANIDLNNLEFSLENLSPYSYYEVPLNILLFNGNELKGINRHIINNFYSGETRQLNLSWSADLRDARRAFIVPELNIFDESIFLKYRGN
ncbi:hypothetical protein JXK06_01120 [Patescibacteria group bacterium]|nr:hypothetical protein [Patescibacteria group bacterium]